MLNLLGIQNLLNKFDAYDELTIGLGTYKPIYEILERSNINFNAVIYFSVCNFSYSLSLVVMSLTLYVHV